MNSKEIDQNCKFTALLATTELGLGSLLHAYSIPLAGHFLSLNQSFLLCRSTQSEEPVSKSTPFQVSMAAAILKSLAPAGKRLTPMLAIAMQGLLFNLGPWIFGRGFIGLALGSALLSVWAFAQPFLLYLLIFGKNLFDAVDSLSKSLGPMGSYLGNSLLVIVATVVVGKMLLAVGVAWLAVNKDARAQEYLNRITARSGFGELFQTQPETLNMRAKLRLVGRDLLQPWFLISLVLTAAFFCLTNPLSVELVWLLLRPVAIGFIAFYTLRFLPIAKWLTNYSGNSPNKILVTVSRTIENLTTESPKH